MLLRLFSTLNHVKMNIKLYMPLGLALAFFLIILNIFNISNQRNLTEYGRHHLSLS